MSWSFTRSWPAVAAVLLFLVILLAGVVGWRASRALHTATQEVRSEGEIRFTAGPLPEPQEQDFESISTPAVFFQAARFLGDLYIAGPAGLSQYNSSGILLKHYAVGRELPSSPLVAMAPAVLADSREPELVIATAQHGLLVFNGRVFRQIFPLDASARTVTSLLSAASGHLLIGTRKRGVLLYDGKKITVLHPTLSNLYVTTLAGNESDLWVGTLDRGVLHWHAGESDSFGEEQGLPDRQVQSIAVSGNTTFVGTVLGVAVFEGGRFSRTLADGVLTTALLLNGGKLLVGSEDQGVIAIPLEGRHRPNAAPSDTSELAEVHQLLTMDDAVFALTRSGLYRMGAHGFSWQPVLRPGAALLSDRNVSALAADSKGRIWVGYFDRGLDRLESDHGPATHIENEHVFCVNRILPNSKDGTIDVATANGLVRFDAAGSQEQVLTRADGLIADHVTDVVSYQDGLALATPAGLTFLDATGARSMYAFQGLVNNHVYALGASGDELMAGTLGGLSQLEKGDMQVSYTTATPGLKHNWITAVVPVGGEWMVGTYGAGVLGLDRSGHFRSFENATGPFEINPNAMLVTPSHVFAGTLGNGLYVYERQSDRWFAVERGLPSANVTALALVNGYLYVGTDNGLVRVEEQKLHP
jgi:ligand-binding sensor domain-containing protein